MLRLNTIVRSYRAGDNVIFSMPEKNGLFLVLSGGLRVFIATDTGREITLISIVSGGCCVLNTLDSAVPGDTVPILQAAATPCLPISTLWPCARCAPSHRLCSSFTRSDTQAQCQTVLNNIEYYFFHPLRSCRPRRAQRKGRRPGTTAHYPKVSTTSAPRARSSAGSWRACVRNGPSGSQPRQDLCAIDRAALEEWPIYNDSQFDKRPISGCQKANSCFWQLGEFAQYRIVNLSDIQRNQVVMFNYRHCVTNGAVRRRNTLY